MTQPGLTEAGLPAPAHWTGWRDGVDVSAIWARLPLVTQRAIIESEEGRAADGVAAMASWVQRDDGVPDLHADPPEARPRPRPGSIDHTDDVPELHDELPPQVAANVRDPRDRGYPALFAVKASTLRANPGKWALVTTGTSEAKATYARDQIRTGSWASFRPSRSFESIATNEHEVWARYMVEAGMHSED